MRLRQKIRGTAVRPRMSVTVSNRRIYVQFMDDDRAATLASVSTLGGDGKKNVGAAQDLGKRAAAAAVKKGIRSVVFDRGGSQFHGRVKAVADAAREAGLRF